MRTCGIFCFVNMCGPHIVGRWAAQACFICLCLSKKDNKAQKHKVMVALCNTILELCFPVSLVLCYCENFSGNIMTRHYLFIWLLRACSGVGLCNFEPVESIHHKASPSAKEYQRPDNSLVVQALQNALGGKGNYVYDTVSQYHMLKCTTAADGSLASVV